MQEKPYDGLPAESDWQPATLGSDVHVDAAAGVVVFVKQQYASTPFSIVGTLHTSAESLSWGCSEPRHDQPVPDEQLTYESTAQPTVVDVFDMVVLTTQPAGPTTPIDIVSSETKQRTDRAPIMTRRSNHRLRRPDEGRRAEPCVTCR